MAKKQTRRSISVSRTTYERLKAFCEANHISLSQFVEVRVGDFLTHEPTPAAPSRPTQPAMPRPVVPIPPKSESRPAAASPVPMTSAAARFAVEPPPPIIKPKQETAAPK